MHTHCMLKVLACGDKHAPDLLVVDLLPEDLERIELLARVADRHGLTEVMVSDLEPVWLRLSDQQELKIPTYMVVGRDGIWFESGCYRTESFILDGVEDDFEDFMPLEQGMVHEQLATAML